MSVVSVGAAFSAAHVYSPELTERACDRGLRARIQADNKRFVCGACSTKALYAVAPRRCIYGLVCIL